MINDPLYIQRHVSLKQRRLSVDNDVVFAGELNMATHDFLTELYRFLKPDYLRFFKMDPLSKTLFLASEAILQGYDLLPEERSETALVFYNNHSSLEVDKQFQATIKSNAFFPSPSLFICTLPNIALGEIAIRNRFMGENCTFIAPNFDAEQCVFHVEALFKEGSSAHVWCGWFDFADEVAEADIFWISREKTNKTFTTYNLNNSIWKSLL